MSWKHQRKGLKYNSTFHCLALCSEFYLKTRFGKALETKLSAKSGFQMGDKFKTMNIK